MAWISVREESEATGNIKAAYEAMRRQMGFVPNVTKALSLWPEVFDLNGRLFEAVMLARTALPNPTKEMIALVVSKANQCNYCIAHHSDFLARYGVSEDVIRQVAGDFLKASLDDKTRALLGYAYKVTREPAQVAAADISFLRALGWSDREILEAAVVAAQFNFINRIVDGLGVELEVARSAARDTSGATTIEVVAECRTRVRPASAALTVPPRSPAVAAQAAR